MLKNSQAFSSFSVDDANKAERFYSETLGLDVHKNSEMEILHVRLPGGGEVILYPKGEDHIPATFTTLNFPVDDIEEAVDTLASKGIKCEQYDGEIKTDEKGIFRDRGISIAWFKDPAGNILSVIQEDS